jgi:hypothetical protein
MSDGYEGVYAAVHHVVYRCFTLKRRLAARLMDPLKGALASDPILGQCSLNTGDDLDALLLRRRQPRALPHPIPSEHRARGAPQQFALLNLGEFPSICDAKKRR